jgi:peroxiredoxin
METPDVIIGWKALDFDLQGTDEKYYNLKEARGENGMLVMFISNHCPYVKAIQNKLVRDVGALKELGVNTIAICSNDPENYPEDNLDNMKTVAQNKDYPFPYVQDSEQSVARSYGAVCTPDFFGFNADLELQYRGRLDDSGMEETTDRTRELFEAMKLIAETGKGPTFQNPSIGCSIKWKD